MEWIADYALKSDELETLNSANPYTRLREAAARIYTSEKYQSRGEIGEMCLHDICRRYFETIPLAPRVFYLTSSNEVVKSFDMVHVRYLGDDDFELWLGEAKFYTDSNQAIKAAIASVKSHIEAGFLKHEKRIIGPQVSKNIPHSNAIRKLFASETSLDQLFETAVFPVLIAADSHGASRCTTADATYLAHVQSELASLAKAITKSELKTSIQVYLIYVPLGSKAELAEKFDAKLKGQMA